MLEQPAAVAVWRRPLVPFAALSASYFAHIGFFNPYLPLWLKSMGLPLFTISLLMAVQSATRMFAPYAWGVLSDRTGERVRLLRLCAIVALLASFGLWWKAGVVWLTLVLLLMFTHTSAMMPMSEAAMAHLVSQGGSFDVRKYGRVRLWGSLGFLLTVLWAGAWFERFGMGSFPLWTQLTLAVVVLSSWLLPHLRESAGDAAAAHHVPVLPVLRQPAVQWFFAAAFFHVLSHIAVYVFFSLFLDGQGYSKSTIGLLWALSVVVEIAWFLTQGRWLPRWPLPLWLGVCAAAMVVRMGLTAVGSAWLACLLLAQMLHALTFAAHHTVCIALLSQYFPGRLRGRGQALYSVLAYGVPGVLGGLLGGAIGARWGLDVVYGLATLSSGAACACVWKLWRCAPSAGSVPPEPVGGR
ncbi:MAG: MFS transporter [Burkholderiaceae bacterium]|nr:MFS transporter [Burkholderiaceae bacterium]